MDNPLELISTPDLIAELGRRCEAMVVGMLHQARGERYRYQRYWTGDSAYSLLLAQVVSNDIFEELRPGRIAKTSADADDGVEPKGGGE